MHLEVGQHCVGHFLPPLGMAGLFAENPVNILIFKIFFRPDLRRGWNKSTCRLCTLCPVNIVHLQSHEMQAKLSINEKIIELLKYGAPIYLLHATQNVCFLSRNWAPRRVTDHRVARFNLPRVIILPCTQRTFHTMFCSNNASYIPICARSSVILQSVSTGSIVFFCLSVFM